MHTVLPLSPREIQAELRNLPGWSHEGNVLLKAYRFTTSRAALLFTQAMREEADRSQHHPEWGTIGNQVVVRLQTHDAGNRVTARDVKFAARIEELSRERSLN